MQLRDHLAYFRDLLRSKTARAFSVVMLANLAVTVIGFLTSVLLFRTQGPELISSIFTLLGVYFFIDQFSDFGMSVAYVRFASAEHEKGSEDFHRTTGATFQAHTLSLTLFALAAALAAPLISRRLFQTEEHADWIRLTAACAWLYSQSNFCQSVAQARKQFARLAWARVVPNLVKTGMILGLIALGSHSFPLFFAAFFLTPALAAPILLPVLDWRSFRPQRHAREHFGRIFHFSKWIFFSTVAVACIAQLDLFMLKSMASDLEVVRYLGGQRLASVLPLLISSMVTILLPKVSAMSTRQELRFFMRKTLLVSPAIFLLILSASFVAPWLIPWTLGPRYETSVPVFQVFCWVYSLDAVVTLCSLFLYNLSLVHWFSILNVTQLALNFTLNLWLIPRYGALGACYTAGAIRLVGVPILLYLGWRERVLHGDGAPAA